MATSSTSGSRPSSAVLEKSAVGSQNEDTDQLITGGAGFIGSYLAHALLEAEHDVFVLDDLSTRSIDNIEPLKTHPRLGYAIDTITNEPAWRWSPSLGNLVDYEPRVQLPEILAKVIEHHRAQRMACVQQADVAPAVCKGAIHLESRFP